MAYEYHVAKTGSDWGKGSKDDPFLTINKAASVAMPGDCVIVHEGEYREWVRPRNKGLSDVRRITYKAAEGEKVVIKGSERVQGWMKIEGSVWKAVLPNAMFGDFNPYQEVVFGDWLVETDTGSVKHLGEVYLNGMSFYEAGCLEDLNHPVIRREIVDNRTEKTVPVHHPEQTKYLWYAEVTEETTTIYANFHDFDPNEELVEINVRPACFYPVRPGIDYITVKGFEMAQAATPWTPPTGDQPGLLGPHWSKGWIIEDNIIHDSKCSGISIGKEVTTGDMFRTKHRDKAGYHYQIEAVFNALHIGWSKEKIGSHIIRNNKIYDCGQNGIVGHLGCVFSEIYNNHIYNIGLKREFYGHEIGGIKLHAAIDVQIHDNRIHDCSMGVWLDWQTQGTRVSRNLFYRNNRDLYVEVSHGPYIVDNNILGSDYSLDNWSQGGAYVNNLICGKMDNLKVPNRPTPYHLPHSTQVAGYGAIVGGDDRYYNNVFVGNNSDDLVGTAYYNGSPVSFEEYLEKTHKDFNDLELFPEVEQPVYINNNMYLNRALPFDKEENKVVLDEFNPEVQIIEDGDQVFLSCNLPKEWADLSTQILDSKALKRVRMAGLDFENPDGSEVTLDVDYFNNKRAKESAIGPIAQLAAGPNRIKVW